MTMIRELKGRFFFAGSRKNEVSVFGRSTRECVEKQVRLIPGSAADAMLMLSLAVGDKSTI